MSISNTFEADILKLVFQGVAIANMADNAVTAPITNIQWSLHTLDPGEAGDQTTNEIAYTGYARVAVARTAAAHPITGSSISPAVAVTFPAGTAGTGTVQAFAVGTAATGVGKVLFSGSVTPNIVTGSGITPSLTTATTITLD